MDDVPFSVYLHLPFCKSRCVYCDFFSTVEEPIPFEAYRKALTAEWQRRRRVLGSDHRLLSLYVGGGTPSLWKAGELCALIETFDLKGDEEVTVEVNPKDAEEMWFGELAAGGVNRFSIGVQSTNDERLSFLGRRHSSTDAVRCVEAAFRSGALSVSADLIYGTFGQTAEEWNLELETVIGLGVHHVSAYELTVAEGTVLDARRKSGEAVTVSEKALVELYQIGRRTLEKAGFSQYEVSNFAQEGHRSKHNTAYWRGGAYLGLGAGAHGFLKLDGRLVRYGNSEDVDDYLAAALENEAPVEAGLGSRAFTEEVSALDHARELIMLGLRTSDGAPFDEIICTLPREVKETWASIAASLVGEKLVRFASGRMIPTARGMLFADGIAERFF